MALAVLALRLHLPAGWLLAAAVLWWIQSRAYFAPLFQAAQLSPRAGDMHAAAALLVLSLTLAAARQHWQRRRLSRVPLDSRALQG